MDINKASTLKVKNKYEPSNHNEKVLKESLKVNKELNVYGKSAVFIGYSLLVVLLTLFISNKKGVDTSKTEIYQIKKQQLAILNALESRSDKELSKNWYEASRSSIVSSVDAVKKTLSELREYDTYSREVINLQNKKIAELKERIKQQEFLKEANILTTKSETIPYSEANYDTLMYRHRLQVNRLKEKHRVQEESFTAVMDLNQPGVREKWIKFTDSQKLEIRKLENKQREKRINFKKNKYIAVSSN